MQRSQGAHPIVLLLFALVLFILNISAVAHCTIQVRRLEQQVKLAQRALDQSKNLPTEEANIETFVKSTRRYASDAGWLAGYQELNKAFLKLLIVTGGILAASIIWVRAPRTS